MTLGRVWGKLGHVRLQELAEGHVEAWMRWALREGRVRGGETGTGLGVTSVEMSLARLKEALYRAVARRLVAVNVGQEVVIPRKVRKAERSAKAGLTAAAGLSRRISAVARFRPRVPQPVVAL
jgi:hypothetical protein